MAVFEKGKRVKRFFSLSTDARPTAEGGIPSGSILVHTDKGDRFIYNAETGEWIPFIGVEDTRDVLEDILDKLSTLDEIHADTKEMRRAVAALANNWSGGDEYFSGDDN